MKISFLACVALIKSFAKNDGFLYLKYSQNISSFISFTLAIISLIHFRCYFNLDFLFLVGVFSAAGSVAGPGVGSRVGILSTFFIGNNLLLRTFSLALNNNRKLLKKNFLKCLQNFIKIL